MKHWFILVTAAVAMSAYAPAPSLAQGIGIEVPGVGVRIGDPDRPRRDREIREESKERVLQERDVRGGRNCRTVTVQEDTPGGSRSKTKEECD